MSAQPITPEQACALLYALARAHIAADTPTARKWRATVVVESERVISLPKSIPPKSATQVKDAPLLGVH